MLQNLKERIDKIASRTFQFTQALQVQGTGGTSQILAEGFTPNSFYVYKQLYSAKWSLQLKVDLLT